MMAALTSLQGPLEGRLVGDNVEVDGVSTDSRTVQAGNLFVALSGPHFDGHRFVAQAQERGAAAALVSEVQPGNLPQLAVRDTLKGLGAIAAYHRSRCTARVVGITGSNGKTTVKELVASIFSEVGPTLATRGNLNNEIGLPLTLLRLGDERFAVVEMGANHAGEIARLTRIARPDVALLNNAGRSHLEGFGSVEGVARAKGEIVEGLASGGAFVYNTDDPWADYWQHLPGDYRRIGFGMNGASDVYGERLNDGNLRIVCADWQIDVRLQLAGEHNQRNAIAAAAAAWALAIDPAHIKAGLERVTAVAGRLQARTGLRGCRLVDDSYNANPDSVAAAIRYLAEQHGRRLLVLGELAELGDGTQAFYRELGETARSAGIDGLWAVEPAGAAAESFGDQGRRFGDVEELLAYARSRLGADDLLLVKGSRRAGLERVVDGLTVQGGE